MGYEREMRELVASFEEEEKKLCKCGHNGYMHDTFQPFQPQQSLYGYCSKCSCTTYKLMTNMEWIAWEYKKRQNRKRKKK